MSCNWASSIPHIHLSHIVNFCPLTKFDCGLLRLHEADEAAVDCSMEDPDKGSSGGARGMKSILIRERQCIGVIG